MTEQVGSAGNYVLRALKLFEGHRDTEALVQDGDRRSYARLRSDTLRLARILHDRGLRPGATVAMMVRDTIDSAALHLALHLIGCRTVWIATYAPVRDQAEFVRLARPDVLIYSVTPRRTRLAAEVTRGIGPVSVFCLGAGGQGPDLLAVLDAQQEEFDPALAGGEPESLFYTGGTTGKPKLVRHGQAFYDVLLAIADYYVAIGEPSMRFLAGSSFTHVSGQMPAFLTLFEGGTFVLEAGWEPAQFLATLERERITSTFLTPWQLYQVIDPAKAALPGTGKPADTSNLRYLNVGGAAAFPSRLAEAIDCFGPAIRLVYGSSEAPLITDFPFLDHDPEHPERLSSCGRPFADTRIEIRDENGAVLPAGEAGEVWFTGSLLMDGYWQEPELTSQTIVDGWLRTGDIGYLDADEYLFLVDRANDMIVTSEAAANVYARPIEDILASHPGVKEAAVIGVPDDEFGEAVHAVVVPVPGVGVTGEELRGLVLDELNDLYTPREIEFTNELPLTPMSKVDKKLLRKRYLANGRAGAAE